MKHISLSSAWKSLAVLCLLANVAAAQTTPPTPTFVITTTASGGGFVDPSAAVVDQGGGKLFKFVPAAGNIVSDVKLDGVSVMSQVKITSTTGYGSFKLENVSAAHALAVTFITDPTPPSTISTSFTGSGAVEPAVYELKNGKTKSFKFTAAPGNIVSDVKVDGTSVLADVKLTNDGAKGSYKLNYFSSPVTAHAIVATFVTDPTPASTITVTSTGPGTVEPATYVLKEGKTKTLKFTATEGNVVSGVTVNGTDAMAAVKLTNNGAKGSLKLDYAVGNKTVAVTFGADPTPDSAVTCTWTGQGIADPATFTLKEGKTKTINIYPVTGHQISAVTLDGTNVMGQVSIATSGKGSYKLEYAPGAHTIAITFSPKQ